MKHFADRLADAVARCGNPVLVGLDPRWEQLPNCVRRGVSETDIDLQAKVVGDFCRGVIDVVARHVAAVKPQSAMFEQFGPGGMSILKQTIDYAADRGLIVILDGKRNDIGSTAEAYAQGYLGSAGQSAWGADAITVSPYLGDDSLTPFVETAQERGAGVFVLVKTSNPGGGAFQDLVAEGRPVYRHVADHVEGIAMKTLGACDYGAVGAVVGATYPAELAELRAAMPHSWLLVPGYGTQGGQARDVAPALDANGFGAIINNSRGLIFAHSRPPYDDRFGETRWQEAVEAATVHMIQELRSETSAGRLRLDSKE